MMRSAKALEVPGTGLITASISRASFSISFRFGAEHLDADRRADAGRQHVDARLDRHGPGVGDAGELQRLVHLLDQLVDRHARSPLSSGFRLMTVSNISVGAGSVAVGARPALPKTDRHLGEGLDDLVLGLQQLRRLGD